ncbi:hypothetical protein LTR17_012614 [Elasticomyces elasticus]|nr:hypothetical protein LTR17_012614 [Elasticomyces elasticus]
MEDPQPCILVRLDSAERAITGLKDEEAQHNPTLAEGTEVDKAPKAMHATVEECDETWAGEGEPTSAHAFIPNPAGEAEADPVLGGIPLVYPLEVPIRKAVAAPLREVR